MARARNSRWTGLAYMAPALAFVALFVMWPLGHLIWLSFTSESLLGGGEFVGLGDDAEVHAASRRQRAAISSGVPHSTQLPSAASSPSHAGHS